MSVSKAILLAACVIAAAVVVHGFQSRYSIAAGGVADVVWRIDGMSGNVSVCGATMMGRSYPEMTPNCSPWSAKM
jgi:hypothetical protein